ncbi:MAG: histidine phosphatase family protein [Gelidibacter sp.]|nr:histidine phosphatase family protein [Gelidibacter sp.]
MRYFISLIFITFFTLSIFAQEKATTEITTYYFIRHAEKDRSNPTERNPHLMDKGLERAEKWSVVLGNLKFDAVYSTDYHRTKETAQPTATKNNLDIIIYDPRVIDDTEAFLMETKGKTVLVVGHSNTTPAFVNAILGEKKHENIDDDNNGNLYIVTIIDRKVTDTVLTIN